MLHIFFLISLIFSVIAYRFIRVPHAHYFNKTDKAVASFMHVLAGLGAGLLMFAMLLALST